MDRTQERLSYRDAARMIYGSRAPDPRELARIDYKVAKGILRGDREREWVTADSVAAYISARAEQRRLGRIDVRSKATANRPAAVEGDARAKLALPPIYRRGLQDYFSAVIHRRMPAESSRTFQRAVLAGQLAPIAMVLASFIGIYSVAGDPPERAAVRGWLDQEVENDRFARYQIVEWFPPVSDPSGTGVRIRVRFRYAAPGSTRLIVTDRTYLVRDGDVAPVIEYEDD